MSTANHKTTAGDSQKTMTIFSTVLLSTIFCFLLSCSWCMLLSACESWMAVQYLMCLTIPVVSFGGLVQADLTLFVFFPPTL